MVIMIMVAVCLSVRLFGCLPVCPFPKRIPLCTTRGLQERLAALTNERAGESRDEIIGSVDRVEREVREEGQKAAMERGRG